MSVMPSAVGRGIVLLTAFGLSACLGSAERPKLTPAQEVASLPCAEEKAHVLMQRLNNVEYSNTVQDLLFLDATAKPASAFPADFREFSGFENESSLMSLSPQLVDEYFAAAVRVSRDAMARSATKLAPCAGGAPRVCAQDALRSLATRAYRRPVEDAELAALMKVYDARASAGHTVGMTIALQAMLLSPNFLFRPTDSVLDDYQLATRLSYFLWQSMPDDELLDHARLDDLSDGPVLEAQVKRMLRHPRSAALTQSFARQWLAFSDVLTKGVDTQLYPAFTPELKQDLEAESLHFFESVIGQDKDPRDIFRAKYSYLNERLATHYGISGVSGTTFRQVALPDRLPRAGVFTQGSMLVGSAGSGLRTSPVTRGYWVLSKILCEPPPPPPPGIPPLDEQSIEAQSVAAVLAQHRANPVCASCHSLMDPIGLGLEPFDNTGVVRTSYPNGDTVPVAGTLPSGASFDGTSQLVGLLTNDARTETCVVEKLMSYALGRRMRKDRDTCATKSIAGTTFGNSASFSGMLTNIVKSHAFRTNDGELTP
jgi:hypothetical protein